MEDTLICAVVAQAMSATPENATQAAAGPDTGAPAAAPKPSGPSWLILGGVGFIGRNLAKELVEGKHAGHVRVADKSHWLTSMMNDDHKQHFANKAIEYKQADLSKDCKRD